MNDAATKPGPHEAEASSKEPSVVAFTGPSVRDEQLKSLLVEAREYAESLMDVVRQPLLVLDEHGKVRSANRSFFRTFQTSRDRVEGRPFDQLGEPRWVLPELTHALAQLRTRAHVEGARLEDTPTRVAGRSMLVSGRPLPRAAQAPWLLLAFEDLTEQMRADAAVRRSERALRDMLGAASEAILIAGGDGRITYANAMAARMFGYPIEELRGLHIETLVPDGPSAEDTDDDESLGEPSANPLGPNRELQARRRDGSVFPADVGLSTMEGERGPLVVAFISDMTALKEHEQRIKAYKQRLQEMAFDAALVEERQRRRLAEDLHDNIGQTLALAQIRLKAALASEPSMAGNKDLGEVTKLLALAMNDIRSLTFELSPPVLYDLGLVAALEWFGEQLEAQHQLHVAVLADERWQRLEVETAALLFRSVRELLTNVVKHADTRNARVSLERDEQWLVVTVADEGKGFAPELLRRVGSGRGFGLFSVREQIIRLGGQFDVTSSPQQGTRITLRIPHNGKQAQPQR